jgi:hypothetical protein
MIDHEMSELEMMVEQEQPEEPMFWEIEHPMDERYLFNPELDEVSRAIEGIQRESPAEIEARYQKGQEMLEVGVAVYWQRHEDQ